jgi:hypothetical protein
VPASAPCSARRSARAAFAFELQLCQLDCERPIDELAVEAECGEAFGDLVVGRDDTEVKRSSRRATGSGSPPLVAGPAPTAV